MKKIDSFTNCYQISKTLRFSLIPVGKTEENFNFTLFLENDKNRAAEYKKAKKLIDKYHKFFIEKALSNVILDAVKEYADLYFKTEKTDNDTKAMTTLETKMRKQIAKSFSSDKDYGALFKKDLIQTVLPKFLKDTDELETVKEFENFTTYFSGFHNNRRNIYTSEPQPTGVAYRCINENLPKFLDNILSFKKISVGLSADVLEKLNEISVKLTGVYIDSLFTPDYFSMVLAQSGIDSYNTIIGGYVTENGTKIQGFNEYINLYNQQNDKSKKLPLLKVLYKQILSDSESVSFLPENFETDNDVITSINTYFSSEFNENLEKLKEIANHLEEYNSEGIFIKSGSAVTNISKAVFGNWSTISQAWNTEYEKRNPLKNKKQEEKYYENQKKSYKAILSFSIRELQRLGESILSEGTSSDIIIYLKETIKNHISTIFEKYEIAQNLLKSNYSENNRKKLSVNDTAIEIIKNLLDSVKNLESLLKSLTGTGKEESKDDVFYGEFLPILDYITSMNALYDKVRNYLTKKPYSLDKIKLNFDNPQLLEGWAKNLEIQRSAQLFKKGENEYYLGIINKTYNENFRNGYQEPSDAEDRIFKMCYEQMASPSKDIPNLMFIDGEAKKVNGRKDADGVNRRLEQAKLDNLPAEVNDLRHKYGYAVSIKNASREEVSKFVEYYINVTRAYA